jgi:hypothetical protein
MKLILMSWFACGAVTDLSDAYLDNELCIETTLQVLRHIGSCGPCRKLIEQKAMVKQRVKISVKAIDCPSALRRAVYSASRVNGQSTEET